MALDHVMHLVPSVMCSYFTAREAVPLRTVSCTCCAAVTAHAWDGDDSAHCALALWTCHVPRSDPPLRHQHICIASTARRWAACFPRAKSMYWRNDVLMWAVRPAGSSVLFPHVTTLHIAYDTSMPWKLPELLAGLPRLRELKLGQGSIDSYQVKLADAFAHTPQLETLDLWEFPQAGVYLAEAIVLHRLANLRELAVTLTATEGLRAVMLSLACAPALRVLRVQCNFLHIDGIGTAALQHVPQLEQLVVCAEAATDTSPQELAGGLHYLPRLKKLVWAVKSVWTPRAAALVCSALAAMPALEELALPLSPALVDGLVPVLQQARQLRAFRCCASCTANSLGRVLSAMPALTHLGIKLLREFVVEEDSAPCLAVLAALAPQLESLAISAQPYIGVLNVSVIVRHILPALVSNGGLPRLRKLTLELMLLRNDGVQVVLDVLLPCAPRLVELTLNNVAMDDVGALALVRALPQLRELQALHVHHNDIQPYIAYLLAKALSAAAAPRATSMTANTAWSIPHEALAAIKVRLVTYHSAAWWR